VIVAVILIVIVAATVIVAVHVHVNPPVGVIEMAQSLARDAKSLVSVWSVHSSLERTVPPLRTPV
jgi:hypothetical protein